MATNNSSQVAFNAGFLSTVVIGIAKLSTENGLIPQFAADIVYIITPATVGFIVWLLNRFLHRVEPYTDEQIKERSRIKNTLKHLKKELKSAKKFPAGSELEKSCIAQIIMQNEKLSKMTLSE